MSEKMGPPNLSLTKPDPEAVKVAEELVAKERAERIATKKPAPMDPFAPIKINDDDNPLPKYVEPGALTKSEVRGPLVDEHYHG